MALAEKKADEVPDYGYLHDPMEGIPLGTLVDGVSRDRMRFAVDLRNALGALDCGLPLPVDHPGRLALAMVERARRGDYSCRVYLSGLWTRTSDEARFDDNLAAIWAREVDNFERGLRAGRGAA